MFLGTGAMTSFSDVVLDVAKSRSGPVCEPEREGCPTLKDLLLVADGELQALPPAEQESALWHSRYCATCKARLHEFEAMMAECASSFDEQFATRAPSASRDREIRFIPPPEHQEQPIMHSLDGVPLNRWVLVAALWLIIMIGVAPPEQDTGGARADQLLQRAAMRAHANAPGFTSRVRYYLMPELDQTASGLQPITVTADLIDQETGLASPPKEVPPVLRRMLMDIGFDWHQPLSVSPLLRWRASVHTRDEVVTLPDPGLVRVRTTTTEGMLRRAEVTMRADNYHVLGQTLDFVGIGRFDIKEVPQPLSGPSPSRLSSSAAGPLVSIRERDVLDLEELRARLILGAAKLEMRGDVRVSRSGGSVHIDGTVAPGVPYRATGAQLAALPHVHVMLRPGRNARVNSNLTPVPTVSPGLERWVDPTFSVDGKRDAFVPTLTSLVTTVRQRLDVLHGLATRYPETEVQALSPEAHDALRRLLDLHYRALSEDLQQLNERMAMICGTERPARPFSHAPSDWRSRAATGLSHATALDDLVRPLLARDDLTRAHQRRIAETFGALWDSLY